MLRRSQDDQIRPFTRIVAAVIVPILVQAFTILFFMPEQSGARFAWPIQPPMTAAYMGAGYLGGAWLFANVVFRRRWHRVASGFWSVTAFTWAMLLATVLHWDRFDPSHPPFQLWLGLYILTPLLVPFVWFLNRSADTGVPDPGDPVVPATVRQVLLLMGTGLLAVALAGLVRPDWRIGIWPWMLTLLTARILSGWFTILGIGGIMISRDARWSAWKAGLESIGLWHLLVVIAAFNHRADFTNGLGNWYVISVIAVLVGMLVLYAAMEGQRRGSPIVLAGN